MAEVWWIEGSDADGWDELAALFTLRVREGLPAERPTSADELSGAARHAAERDAGTEILFFAPVRRHRRGRHEPNCQRRKWG